MHISSLPSKHGIGTLGKEAYNFVDFLKSAGQTYWQVLPVGATGFGNSPYQSFSAFAGNPYFIDLELLEESGLLCADDYRAIDWGDNEDTVDYDKISAQRFSVLRRSFVRFQGKNSEAFKQFSQENKFWLEDYALFMALKGHFSSKSWQDWDDKSVIARTPESLEKYKTLLREEIDFWEYVQFLFFSQWKNLKDYANSQGIKIIGDVPFYVSMDSSDTWAQRKIFRFDEDGHPLEVAGVPPDAFSEDGQLWNMPVYDWEYLKATEYEWGMQCIAHAAYRFDVIRIDHFRGFDTYYAVPAGELNARNGVWRKAYGMDFFPKMKERIGKIPIIAEDLGMLCDSVYELLAATGYPGMKILHYAFETDGSNCYLPHNYERNSVVYTGTHDNNTIMGWFNTGKQNEIEFAENYCALNPEEGYNWGMIRTAYSSVSNLAIIPIQDFLGRPEDCRMNTPGTMGPANWSWRVRGKVLTSTLAEKIKHLTEMYGR